MLAAPVRRRVVQTMTPIFSRSEFRAIWRDPDRRRRAMKDLDDVGPDKPVGYLPGYTLKVLIREDLRLLKRRYRAKGMKVMIRSGIRTTSRDRRVYVYDPVSVARVIDLYRPLLVKHSWPVKSDRLVAMLARYQLDCGHPLMPMIKQLFADPF